MKQLSNNLNYSYWELRQYFGRFDLVVIGAGIVGLSAAISFKQKNMNATVLIVERGMLPNGASTKNAGFACFGSAGELLSDLGQMEANDVWDTVKMRWQGLIILRKRLGDKALCFKKSGGFELFSEKEKFELCRSELTLLNQKMNEAIGIRNCYKVPRQQHGFKNISGIIHNQYEGEIDTGLMMENLSALARRIGVKSLNGVGISSISDQGNGVELQSESGTFKAARVIVATNGFARQLLGIKDVKPARAQVLVTQPIKNLNIKGTYHYDEGYYYFRAIDNRILLGGGRNLDLKTEETFDPGLNAGIQKRLDAMLKNMILPGIRHRIEARWTGIMGVGRDKKPIIRPVSKNVIAAVRMGGMGIAIGSMVGEKAVSEIL